MKKVVSRIVRTTDNGARELDHGLDRLARRANIMATQYAVAPAEEGVMVKVQITMFLLPNTEINLMTWFASLTDGWLEACRVFELDDVKVRDA